MILNSPYISGSLTVTNLSGSGVRYLMTSASGLLISQTADAAIKNTYTASATAGQTVFPVTNGYSTGLVDVYLNGTKLASSDYSDADGVNITLVTGSDAGDLLEFVKYSPALGVTNNALRQLTTFTSSEGQTVYSASYTPGLLDVYYNGSRLTPAEYTANNGTYITLATGSSAGDIIDMLVYSYQVGAFSGVGGTGTANQVAYWGTTNAITGSPNFTVSGSTLAVTGSFTVITGSAAEFTVNATGVNIGNALTDSHIISGSLRINPNGLFVSSSGLVGINTLIPSYSLDIVGTNSTGSLRVKNTGMHAQFTVDGTTGLFFRDGTNAAWKSWLIATSYNDGSEISFIPSSNTSGIPTWGTTAMVIQGNGRVGIGTTSPAKVLDIYSSSSTNTAQLKIGDAGSTIRAYLGTFSNNFYITSGGTYAGGWTTDGTNGVASVELSAYNGGSQIVFTTANSNTSPTERMRVTSVGFLKTSNTGNYFTATSTPTNEFKSDVNDDTMRFVNTNTSYASSIIQARGARNTTNQSWYFLQCYNDGSGLNKLLIADSGNVTNTNGSYGAFSDIKLKENITDATPKLDKLMQVKIRNYNLIGSEEKQIGVVAQELEEIFPGMIEESNDKDGEGNDLGTTTKSVKYSVFVPMLIKALQEANAKITALEEKLERNNIQ